MNIRNVLITQVMVTLLIIPALSLAKSDSPSQNERYIVKFKANSKASVMNAIQNNQGQVKLELDKHRIIAVNLPAPAAKQFKNRSDVEFVELDPKRYLLVEDTPYGIGMVEAVHDNQHPFMTGSANTNMTVCIMDTGYDIYHEDLPNNTSVIGEPVITGSDGYDNNDSGNWYEDGHGHGTHVSGTIAALGYNGKGVVGVNPNDNLKIHMVKVFNSQGSWAYGSDLVAAVDQCIAAGANVISMSLGGSGSSEAEQEAFDQAYAIPNGILSIAAAGNDGNSGLSYPASYDSVMSVAAVDSAGNKASFSQYNSQVEIAAPGVGVKSTLPNNSYASWNGTSMATPHVAGVAALVWNYFPECSNHQVRIAMAQSAEDRGSLGRDNSYGYGIVKAKAMFDVFADGCEVGDFPPMPEPTHLVNGETVDNLSGASGDELMYQMNVPEGAFNLAFNISAGSGDADLYVKFGSKPSITSYDCRPYKNGNIETCSAATPSIGTYYVMLRAYTNFSGVVLQGSFEETIPNEPPSSEFTYSCTDLVCDFDGSDSTDNDGTITTYNWSFDDVDSGNNNASGVNSSHTFSSDGDYTVTLTVVDDASASATSSQTFGVLDTTNKLPTASFIPSCTDLVCDFDASASSDSDGTIELYEWMFGDGNTTTGVSPSNAYASAGSFTVTLTVTDNEGGIATSEQTFVVTEAEAEQPIDDAITLTLTGSSVKRTKSVDLVWTNVPSTVGNNKVDIYRTKKRKTNKITTTNDGAHKDSFNGGGTFVYKVCQVNKIDICSPEKTIEF